MSGRITLVTGAGRGAGNGIAVALGNEGGTVVVCDLDPDTSRAAAEGVRKRGAESLSIPCDVSEEQNVEKMMAQIVETYGTIDVLVNTVAWIDPPGPIVDLPTERWHKAIRTNLDSVMYTTRAALRVMIQRRGGVIINISSINGTRGFPDRASYGATKAAVINFTQTTAMENRKYGVRANCLVPGRIQGERLQILGQMMAELSATRGEQPVQEPMVDGAIESLDPEWIGQYVSFLVSDKGRHINGQALVIGDGPRSPLQAIFPDL